MGKWGPVNGVSVTFPSMFGAPRKEFSSFIEDLSVRAHDKKSYTDPIYCLTPFTVVQTEGRLVVYPIENVKSIEL